MQNKLQFIYWKSNNSSFILNEYYYLLIFLVLSLIISIIVFFLSFILVKQNSDSEKISSFECGFEPFEDTRSKFSIKFYLVAILFIIFDLEISYLFPWCLNLNQIGFFGFWSMILFLIILTIGFIYEWLKGALDWH